MNQPDEGHAFGNAARRLLFILLCTTLIIQPVKSQQWHSYWAPKIPLPGPDIGTKSDGAAVIVPRGTILPVRLNSTISSAKCKPGQVITSRIMQDVPLSPGVKIREGSKVIGHIVEVTPAITGAGARISFQFDKVISLHQTISITTNLRAIAGFMRIIEAQTPPIGPGESDVYRWLTTVQVGGDVAYGDGGPVTTGENANDVVGKVINGGVVGRIRAKEGTKCRGAIDGNDTPQALWVFSSDACGTYGLAHVEISHAGRSNPTALIVLASDTGNLAIRSGAGMLLRVDDPTNESSRL